ncbi:hypothetical protein GTO91_15230 [Heliobacterium undosum]|uniref:Uncharacterized protein n=1 Tax=Heliomicrobium undosum TaxID=121734 RepID=A0A845L372_9FIRM|nr:hypothetical protein [Heliomicrobium undosum]MZP31067.1 hypothetical protein [Heliomicrobium undosum]
MTPFADKGSAGERMLKWRKVILLTIATPLLFIAIFAFVIGSKFFFLCPLGWKESNPLDNAKDKHLPPTRISIIACDQDENIAGPKQLLTDDPSVIRKITDELDSLVITNLKDLPKKEPYYELHYEREPSELVYPFRYYPRSDIVNFCGPTEYGDITSFRASQELKKQIREKGF